MGAKEQRDTDRTKRRVRVKYGVDKTEKSAFTRNLSSTGLFIGTNNVFPPGATVQVELIFPDRSFKMWARVIWAKKVPPQLAHILDCGMGICFSDPSVEWVDFFSDWQAQFK